MSSVECILTEHEKKQFYRIINLNCKEFTPFDHDVVSPKVSMNYSCVWCIFRICCISAKLIANFQLFFNLNTKLRTQVINIV